MDVSLDVALFRHLDLLKVGSSDEIATAFQKLSFVFKISKVWKYFIRESIKYGRFDTVKYLLGVDLPKEKYREFLVMACIFHNSGPTYVLIDNIYKFDDDQLDEIYRYASYNNKSRIVDAILTLRKKP